VTAPRSMEAGRPWRMPWERREGESASAYARFCAYLALGPLRSLAKAVESSGRSLGRLKQLSVKWNWPARAIAHDHYQFAQARQAECGQYRESQRRWLRDAVDWQAIGRAEFASWVRRGENGELEPTREPSYAEAFRLWQAGCQAERRILGPALPDPSSSSGEEEDATMERERRRFLRAQRDAADELVRLGASSSFHRELEDAVSRLLSAWLYRYVELHAPPGEDTCPLQGFELWPWHVPFPQA